MENFGGQQVGNYAIHHLLGSGGDSDVYLGNHIDDRNNLVAIKFFKHDLFKESDRKRYQKEIRILHKLQHKNIIKILDVGIENQIPFLVMQYAPQGALGHDRLDIPTIAKYLTQITDGLQYAHDKHVIHCDIKPENILLRAEDEVLLSDFSVSIITQTHTLSAELSTEISKVFGTVFYMAPEHINGKPGKASDQYSLGIVVYEWLCGTRPFVGKSLYAIAQQHIAKTPPSLQQKNPSIPSSVEDVIFKALAKKQEDRFSSVSAFNQAFQNALVESKLLPPTSARDFSKNAQIPTIVATPSLIKKPASTRISLEAHFLTSLITIILTLAIVFGFPLLAQRIYPQSPILPLPTTNIIKIGVDLPLSGNDEHDGLPLLNALTLAIAQEKSSFPHYSLELDVHNDVGLNNSHDPAVGAKNVQQMIADAQDAAIIGPFNSSVALDELPKANSANIALISPSTTSICLTSNGPSAICAKTLSDLRPTKKTTFFRTTVSDSIMGTQYADFLTGKFTIASVITDPGAYGSGFSRAFISEWVKDTKTTPTEYLLPPTTDQNGYEKVIEKISMLKPKPDLIFYAGQTPNATLIHTLMEQNAQLATTAFAVGGGVMNASFLTNIDGLQSGPVYGIAPVGDIFSSASTNGLSFYTNYISNFDGQPTPYAASAYDCANILIKALSVATSETTPPANSQDKNRAELFRNAVITYLQQFISYDGVTGHYSFDSNGDPNNGTTSLYQFNTSTQRWIPLSAG